MGVPPYLLTSTIELIIAQRLVRKLCQACKVPTAPHPDVLELAKRALANIHSQDEIEPEKIQGLVFYDAKGCVECDGIGYRGRLGLYEIMRMNNEIRRLLVQSASSVDIEKAAIKNGMVSLEQIGIIKALKGETSLEEVYRVAKRMEEY
jgi:type IV pilus assembly protein PilB